jgi:hypothetical protein
LIRMAANARNGSDTASNNPDSDISTLRLSTSPPRARGPLHPDARPESEKPQENVPGGVGNPCCCTFAPEKLLRNSQPGFPPQPLPFVSTQTDARFKGACWNRESLLLSGNIDVDKHVKGLFLMEKHFSLRIGARTRSSRPIVDQQAGCCPERRSPHTPAPRPLPASRRWYS